MTLDEIKAKLTPREFSVYQALVAEDSAALAAFGKDLALLRKSVEAKLGAVAAPTANPEEATSDSTVREHALVLPDFEAPTPEDRVSILDRARIERPPGKSEIRRGHRVMFRGTGAAHRVTSVDQTANTVTLDMFGKPLVVSRELVSRVAPNEFDPRFSRTRRQNRPMFAGAHAPRDDRSYDLKDD